MVITTFGCVYRDLGSSPTCGQWPFSILITLSFSLTLLLWPTLPSFPSSLCWLNKGKVTKNILPLTVLAFTSRKFTGFYHAINTTTTSWYKLGLGWCENVYRKKKLLEMGNWRRGKWFWVLFKGSLMTLSLVYCAFLSSEQLGVFLSRRVSQARGRGKPLGKVPSWLCF